MSDGFSKQYHGFLFLRRVKESQYRKSHDFLKIFLKSQDNNEKGHFDAVAKTHSFCSLEKDKHKSST